VWYTGHVTAGGSICIEALTLSGGPNGWNAALCVESVLNLVITNMCAQIMAPA
jgi:ubiquitin-conjugating enzyme E2 Q